MSKLFSPKVRVVALPVIAFAGGMLALIWPLGHQTFCAGFAALGV